MAVDCDRYEQIKGHKTVLNEGKVRRIHYDLKQWNEWLESKAMRTLTIDQVTKYIHILPIVKDFESKVEEDRAKFVERIKRTQFQKLVLTLKEQATRDVQSDALAQQKERKCIHCIETKLDPIPVLCGHENGRNTGRQNCVFGTKGFIFDHIKIMLDNKLKDMLYVPRYVDCPQKDTCKGKVTTSYHTKRINLLFLERVYKYFFQCANCGKEYNIWEAEAHSKGCLEKNAKKYHTTPRNNDHLNYKGINWFSDEEYFDNPEAPLPQPEPYDKFDINSEPPKKKPKKNSKKKLEEKQKVEKYPNRGR